jgi:protein TonB
VSTGTKRTRVTATIAVSVALHGAAWAAVARVPPAPARARIELEVMRRPRQVAVAPAPPPAVEPPRPVRAAPRPAPRPVVAMARPAPGHTPAPPPAPEPPPALASAASQASSAPGAPRALPRVGLSLGSTVAAGGFAVGVGNTVYGRADETAADPATVGRYAGGVVPAARLSAPPRPLDLPRIEYPGDARKEGLEGRVALVLRIDARGAVVAVRVVGAPSPSLAAAAADGARRFRFSPALADGEAVETEIRFTYTFLLD